MIRRTLLALSLLTTTAGAQAPRPKDGYVPTEGAAIAIAKVVLASMYSDQMLKTQEPFHAELQDHVWAVAGKWNPHPNPNIKGGGGLNMRINKQTGEILGYYFSR